MVNPAPAKVSVVIPVYNGTNYLCEAIDSVLAQTYPNIELIVVDDGSTDGTRVLIESYGKRLTGYYKKNGGIASALNYGIQRANGAYIAWLSHDDQFLPEKITRQIQFLAEHPEFQACYTDFKIIDIENTVIQHYRASWQPKERMVRSLFRDMYINGSTILISRACFDAVGLFDEDLPHTQDLEMWCRLANQFAVGHIAEALVLRRDHPAQLSRKVSQQVKEDQDTYLRIFRQLGPERLFPERSSPPYSATTQAQQLAKAYIWLGDEMCRYRRWYRFSADCYSQAVSIVPSWMNPARIKWGWMMMLIILLGDEHRAAARLRRAYLLLRQGDYHGSRILLLEVLRYRPWRLDALALMVLSLTGQRPMLILIGIKRASDKLHLVAW